MIRIAISGAGAITERAHIPALRSVAEAQIVAIQSRTAEKADRVARALWPDDAGRPKIYSDFDEMLARETSRRGRNLHAESFALRIFGQGAGGGRARARRKADGADGGGCAHDGRCCKESSARADGRDAAALWRRRARNQGRTRERRNRQAEFHSRAAFARRTQSVGAGADVVHDGFGSGRRRDARSRRSRRRSCDLVHGRDRFRVGSRSAHSPNRSKSTIPAR